MCLIDSHLETLGSLVEVDRTKGFSSRDFQYGIPSCPCSHVRCCSCQSFALQHSR
ncbi:hypothetical protein M758_4G219400 [Ceratodon purpureus]|nr:hypothetical protein M758_4G219400 [Ceratodon purpureus]